MKIDGVWQRLAGLCLRDQPQVQLELFRRQAPNQERRHTLRAAAAKMRNQQQDLRARIRGLGVILKISASIVQAPQ